MLLALLLLLLPAAAWAQSNVSGTVRDAAGAPVAGVSVVVKGTTIGATTDVGGNYSITAPSNATLVFSFMGLSTKEEAVNGQTRVDVQLSEDAKSIDEVVVVGYGTQKKSDITGSVTSVPKERLSNLPVTNVLQAVQGVAAGVSITQSSSIPGDAPSAMVRGRNSINASSDPYIVVDGIPLSKTDGSLNDINPNDIASIEILKDASATAIYGTNGANGVILISTKRGASGKPVIRYSGYAGVEEIAHILEPGSPEQLLERYAEYSRIQGSALYQTSPVRNEYEFDNYQKGITTDWLDAVLQTGVIQNHNVSISGGNEYARYYISGGIQDQKGVVKGYNYKRYDVRSNLDVNATKWLTIGTTLFLSSQNRDGGRANLLNAAAMSPYGTMYKDDGSYTQYPMYSESLWANPLLPTTLNPERRQWNITANGYAEVDFGNIWQPLSGLKYKLNAGYTYVPKHTSEYEGESVYNMNGWGRIYNYESRTWTVENILSYSKDIDEHHFDLTGVYAAKEKFYADNYASGDIFPNDVLGWWNLGAASTKGAGSYADLYTTLSQMGRLNYSYDSRYLLTFTVRRDGSSVFGASHKYGVFPSVAVGWNIARESFMEPTAEVLNNLKLRVSYGKTGNEAIGIYSSLTKMTNSTLAMGGSSLVSMDANASMGNEDLSWETTTSTNIGLDFGLLNNRITGTLDFYKSNTSDLLLQRNLPKATGYANVWTNIGATANTGLELTINSTNVKISDFAWSTGLVFSWNKNELTELYGDGLDDIGNRWFIGNPIGVIYDYTLQGVWQEDEIAAGAHLTQDPTALAGDLKLADISGPAGVPDGIINDDDRSILGQTTPKWIGGMTNTFTYKGVSLSIFINTVQGALRNNSQLGTASDELGRRNGPADIGYWTPANKSNEWRSLGNHSNIHGYGFPKDASYTRIKDITLSYTFPTTLVQRIGINGLQIYASGRNLYTFTDWLGWDPEARDIVRGSTDWGINYPTVRSYVFGINLTL
jgi:TonB-linked SusC/RagA family outer membrane protein